MGCSLALKSHAVLTHAATRTSLANTAEQRKPETQGRVLCDSTYIVTAPPVYNLWPENQRIRTLRTASQPHPAREASRELHQEGRKRAQEVRCRTLCPTRGGICVLEKQEPGNLVQPDELDSVSSSAALGASRAGPALRKEVCVTPVHWSRLRWLQWNSHLWEVYNRQIYTESRLVFA